MRYLPGAAVAVLIAVAGCREGVAPYEPEPAAERGISAGRITSSRGPDQHPRWSASGDSIYYGSGVFDGDDAFSRSLLRIPAAGGAVSHIDPFLQTLWRGAATPPLALPVPSPDQSRLAYIQLLCAGAEMRIPCDERATLTGAILRVRTPGTVSGPMDDPGVTLDIAGMAAMARLPMRPSWSPDGSRIASSDFNGLLILDVVTGTVVRPVGGEAASMVAWSPDGSEIAFARGDASGLNNSIMIMDVAGGAVTLLTQGTEPAWSPDGSTIYYARIDGEPPFHAQRLLSIPRAGGEPRLLAAEFHARTPAVSPDGRWLAYSGGATAADYDLYIIALQQ